MTETTRTTNTVQVGFSVLGKIEVDDNVNSLNIDTTGEQVRADQVTAHAVPEVVENTVTSVLEHLGMRVEARVAKLGDLLGEKLDTVSRVAEDDGLVDLKLVEKCVQAMNLLLLFNKGVVLGDTAESEFVHQVDLVWLVHVLVLEALDNDGEGRGEEHDLTILRVESQELLNDRGEFRRKKLVSFIHDEGWAGRKVSNALARQVQYPSRRTHNDVDRLAQTDNVVLEARASSGDHDIDAQVLAKGLADLRGLESQFSRRHQDQGLGLGALGVNALKSGNYERSGLAGAILGAGQNITAGQSDRNRLLLDGRRLFEASLEDAHHQLSLNVEILELQALSCCNIFRLYSVILRGCLQAVLPVR